MDQRLSLRMKGLTEKRKAEIRLSGKGTNIGHIEDLYFARTSTNAF